MAKNREILSPKKAVLSVEVDLFLISLKAKIIITVHRRGGRDNPVSVCNIWLKEGDAPARKIVIEQSFRQEPNVDILQGALIFMLQMKEGLIKGLIDENRFNIALIELQEKVSERRLII
ncbi:MAG: hypothetical protein ABH830_01875 [Patescibacteria group bacterium]